MSAKDKLVASIISWTENEYSNWSFVPVLPSLLDNTAETSKSVITSVEPRSSTNMSLPNPPDNISVPAPPISLSTPAPPLNVSSPAPPLNVSSPEPPLIVSSPASARNTLASWLPIITSSNPVPRTPSIPVSSVTEPSLATPRTASVSYIGA